MPMLLAKCMQCRSLDHCLIQLIMLSWPLARCNTPIRVHNTREIYMSQRVECSLQLSKLYQFQNGLLQAQNFFVKFFVQNEMMALIFFQKLVPNFRSGSLYVISLVDLYKRNVAKVSLFLLPVTTVELVDFVTRRMLCWPMRTEKQADCVS